MADRIIRAPSISTIVRGRSISKIVSGARGLPGPRGLAAKSGALLMCEGRVLSATVLGPFPVLELMSFTSATSRIICTIAPTTDQVFTIWKNGTLVGGAMIDAGELEGVVALTGGGFTAEDPDILRAICPIAVDPTMQTPILALG